MARAGTRIAWTQVPPSVRAMVEAELKTRVVAHENCAGGFSPGPAGPATLADGRTVFIKACGDELSATATAMHRSEAANLAAFTRAVPAPRLERVIEHAGWVVLVTELLPGSTPATPLAQHNVDAVLELITQVSETAIDGFLHTLNPVGTDERERSSRFGWRRLVEAQRVDGLSSWNQKHIERLVDLESNWVEAAAGRALLHRDLRIDNVVIDDGVAVAVDWSDASIGAPWIDLVGLLPSLEIDGGPAAEQVFASHPVGQRADGDAVNVYLASLAGYFVHASMLPPPPGVEGLRDFQRAQGRIACRWLRSRLDW